MQEAEGKKKKKYVASVPSTCTTQQSEVNKWSFVEVRKWTADRSSEIERWGELTLAGHQVPTKDALSLHLFKWTGG